MDKLIALIPERLRSRKLVFAALVEYMLLTLSNYGIEIDPSLQATLMTIVGGGYITIQGLIDLVKAWKGTPNVDKPEG